MPANEYRVMIKNLIIKHCIHASNLALIWAVFFLSGIAMASFPQSAHAQASMSGGGYTLNGGLAVFDGDLSGGGYTLGALGDPSAAQSTGGDYSLMPTPFGNEDFVFTPPSAGGGSVAGANSGPTGGYTLYPTSTASSVPYNPYYPWQLEPDSNPNSRQTPVMEIPKDPTFDPSRPTTGVQWIDGGKGVDVDFDGVPDVFASTTFGGEENPAIPGSAASNPPLVKIYATDLSLLQAILAIFFMLCMWFARIIRAAPRADLAAPLSIGNLQTFRVSRIPLAIFLDYVIAFHKTKGSESVPHPLLRDFELENNAHLAAPDKNHTKASNLLLLDGVIVPALTVACVAWSWPISWVLSLVFVALLAIRFFIGKKILQG